MKITMATDPGLVGRGGIILDETKNTLVIEEGGRKLTIPKKAVVFNLILPTGEGIEVDGSRMIMRPEERIKKLR